MGKQALQEWDSKMHSHHDAVSHEMQNFESSAGSAVSLKKASASALKRFFASRSIALGLLIGMLLFSPFKARTAAQEDQPNFHVVISLVQLNVAVTDSKGKYITGIHPQDFVITEDGIQEKIATFAEGNEPTQTLAGSARPPQDPTDLLASAATGANVFVLFDTSNYMYRGFVFAQDAIAEFVRSLDSTDRVAFYSYSRDFSRGALLTSDRMAVLRGVRATVAGDDAALYDSLLLTLEDASQFTGRKVIVVFSNGP